MNTFYWLFAGSGRVDLLVETTDRAVGEPLPDVLSVSFFGDDTLCKISSDTLIPAEAP